MLKINHWLIKSEPSSYSIDNLKRDESTPWSGVRNFQARNFMRDQMRIGELALFYHSSENPPGIVGIAKVASPHTHFGIVASRVHQCTCSVKRPRQGRLLRHTKSCMQQKRNAKVGVGASLSYPDPTQFDKKSPYYDPRAIKERPIWFLVDFKFVKKFKDMIPLTKLKGSSFFADMLVTQKGNRLSVQPVAKKHFEKILEFTL